MVGKTGKNSVWVIVLIIAVLVFKHYAPDRQPHRDPGSGRATPSREASAPASGTWAAFEGCRLVDERGNDGDSFTVRLPDGRERQFRLYFVDAPETAIKTYRGGETNAQRVAEQARYFGMDDPEEATAVGREAKRLTAALLGAGPFTVHTCHEAVYGSERLYAHVRVAAQGKEQWLDEVLVRHGVARIHTKPADLPDGTPGETRRQQLRQLEATAKKQRAGGWK